MSIPEIINPVECSLPAAFDLEHWHSQLLAAFHMLVASFHCKKIRQPLKCSCEEVGVTAGHNWGSVHDMSVSCVPSGSEGGKYLMYPYTVNGLDRNNKVFLGFLCTFGVYNMHFL